MSFQNPFRSILLPVFILVTLAGSGSQALQIHLTSITKAHTMPAQATISKEVVRKNSKLDSFINQVKNGKSGTLVGVYATGVFAYPVAQQPDTDPIYVSPQPGILTQFRIATKYGGVGLLAHNTLAGSSFYRLTNLESIILVYGDGSTRPYRVSSIKRYQALNSNDPYSNFIDLDYPTRRLTSGEVFNQVYTQGDRVIFQTCIEKNGDPSWGRIFITAMPVRATAEQYRFAYPPSFAFN